MADFEIAMRSRAIADPAVNAIVGERVAWEEQPQKTPLPHLTLNVISDPRLYHLKGMSEGRDTRVQVDARAETKAEALKLARAMIAAMLPPGFYFGHTFGRVRVDGPRPLNEIVNGKTVFRQSVDLIIWHVGD
jgi:hypothetical protein